MKFASKCAIAVAVVAALIGPSTSVDAIVRPAATANIQRATRATRAMPALDPATGRVVVIGDSILFNRINSGPRSNRIVPLAAEALESRYPGMSVRNLSFPGLSTVHSIESRGTTLRPYLTDLLNAPGPRPQVVVIAVSSIDINLLADTAVTDIAPVVVNELLAIERWLREMGIATVFVPAFGINGALYNELRSVFNPYRDYRFGERVNTFNELLVASGLPLLFHRFEKLDGNGDGNADRPYFVAYDPTGRWPDDGIHPNALGEQVFGDNLANALVAAFERG